MLSWTEAGWLMTPAESQEGAQAAKVMSNHGAPEGMRTWRLSFGAPGAGHD